MAKNWALKYTHTDKTYVDLGQQASLLGVFDPGDKWTVDMWIYSQTLPFSAWSWLFCKAFTSHSTPYYQFDIRWWEANSYLEACIWRSDAFSGYLTVISPNNSILLENWYHIEVDVDLSIPYMELFLNGISQQKDITAEGTYSNFNTSCSLGINLNLISPSYAFTGIIDEVRVSDIIRHTANFTPPTRKYSPDANTMGLWHFDEGTGTIAYDVSGNGNNATLSTPAPTWVAGCPNLKYGRHPALMGQGLAGTGQISRGLAR